MRYKLAIFFSFFALTGSAQIVKTAGIPYTATAPSHTPSASGSAWAIDTANLDLYAYYGGAWNLAGERIQTISGCTAPAYTPGKGQSLFVINGCDSLYYYRSGAWVRINAGGGGGGGGISDGDKGDIDVSASGSVWTIDTSAVTRIKIAADAIDSTKIENLRISLSDIAGAWGVQNGSVLKWNGTNWRPSSDNTGTDGNGIYSGDGDIPTNTDATLPTNSFMRFEWPSGNTAFIMDDFGDTVYLADPSLASSVLVSASKVGLRSTGNIELWGGTGGAKLRMLEPTGSGTNYTQIQVGAQSADITYTLPATTGSNGQYLQFTTGGQLQWSTVAAGVTDGDKDDITVSGSGANWNIRNDSVTSPKILNGTILFEDIGQNSASNGQVIKWNGTAWAAAADNTGGAGSTDLSWTGASSPYTLNSSSGTDVDFAQGGGITLSTSGATLTIAAADQSATNEGSLTVGAGISTTSIINSNTSGSTGVTISASTGLSISESGSTITLTNSAPDQTVGITGTGITVVSNYPNFTLTAADQSATNEVLTISDGTNTEALGGQTLTVAGGGINTASYNATTNTLTISGTENDGSATNEGILGVGAGSGTTATITTNTTTGNAVTIEGGGIVAITETTSSNGGTITITATENDGSTTNELQTIANTSNATSHTVTLSNLGGSVQLIEGAGIDLTTGGTSGAGTVTIASTLVGVTDGDKGDIDVTAAGTTWTIDTGSVTTGKIANATILFEDIAANSASFGQVIKWNGSSWGASSDNNTDQQSLSIDSSIVGNSERFAVSITNGNTVRFDVPQGTVTSVGITQPAAGITVSGSPVTTSGSITLALANDLGAVEGLNGTGIAVRTGDGTWATRSLTGTIPVVIENNTAVSANPLFYISQGDFGDVDITNSNIGAGLRGDIWTIDTGSINSVKIANSTILFEDIAANGASNGQVIKYNGSAWVAGTDETGGGGVSDGDKGDITVSGSGATWTIDADVVDSTNVGNKTLSVDDLNGGWGAAAGTPLEWNGTNWRPGVDSNGIYSGSGNIPANTIANVVDYFGFQYDTGLSEAIGINEVAGSTRIGSSDGNNYMLAENDSITIGSDRKVVIEADTFDISRATVKIGFPTSGGGVTDGDKGDIDVTASGATWTVDTSAISTIKIADAAVTYAKIQNVSGNSVLARTASGSGVLSEVTLSASNLLGRGSTGNVNAITLGSNLSMSGTALSATGTDLTISGSTSPVTLTSNTGSDITINAGDGIALSSSASSNLTIATTRFQPVVYEYTTPQTNTSLSIPSGATFMEVICIGGGGGGGSGRRGASSEIRCGGGGGSNGGGIIRTFATSVLSSPLLITVGSGGAGGAARTTDNTNGADGAFATESLVTSSGSVLAHGWRGDPGSGGTTATGAGGGSFNTGTSSDYPSAAGGSASVTGGAGAVGNTGARSSGSPGGSGGGLTAANVASDGGAGGEVNYRRIAQTNNGTVASPNASNGWTPTIGIIGGGGGGGGASRATGGAGGNGGAAARCGGGGGGGASTNGNNSGAGGAGGNGYVRIIFY